MKEGREWGRFPSCLTYFPLPLPLTFLPSPSILPSPSHACCSFSLPFPYPLHSFLTLYSSLPFPSFSLPFPYPLHSFLTFYSLPFPSLRFPSLFSTLCSLSSPYILFPSSPPFSHLRAAPDPTRHPLSLSPPAKQSDVRLVYPPPRGNPCYVGNVNGNVRLSNFVRQAG